MGNTSFLIIMIITISIIINYKCIIQESFDEMNKNCDCNNTYNTILKIGYYYGKEEKVVVKVNI